jgi:hypothetical protein
MIASRRRFLFGAATSLIAAPAIVRVAANLMPVRSRAMAMLYGRSPAVDALGDMRFLQGMAQTINQTIFYGDSDVSPLEFTGFASFYGVDAAA